MKARIKRDSCGYYNGQVYKENEGWKTVTDSCITKLGAKRELEKWKQKHCPEEFEL